MHKVAVEEELPEVFTFHVALSNSTTYYQWRDIGAAQQLATDEDIACFLIQCYEKSRAEAHTDIGVCDRCQTPLKPMCLTCWPGYHSLASTLQRVLPTSDSGDMTQPPMCSIQHPVPDLAQQPLSSSPHPVGPVQHVVEAAPCLTKQTVHVFHNHVCVKEEGREQNSIPSNSQTQKFHNTVESLDPNPADWDSHPDKELSPVWQKGGQSRSPVIVEEEETETVTDWPPFLPFDPTLNPAQSSQPSGRGRPRLYPAVNLVCAVCNRKLSSRQALFSHMTSQHPAAQLPSSLLHLAARSAAAATATRTAKPRARKGCRRKSIEGKTVRKNVDGDAGGCDHKGVGADRERDGEGKGRGGKVKDRDHQAFREKRKAELESLVCETCGTSFRNKRQMYTHRRLCTWKVCHLCGKSVKLLEMHLKRHSAPRRFPCPHCPKSFLFRNYLESHLLYHNGERPFCCEICGTRYREKARLNAHIRTHTGVKPFKCNQCDAAFTRPRGLHDHMRVHTGEKPYGCQVCGRQFSSSGNLAAHRRKVHKLQPQAPNRMTRKLFVEPTVADGDVTDGGGVDIGATLGMIGGM